MESLVLYYHRLQWSWKRCTRSHAIPYRRAKLALRTLQELQVDNHVGNFLGWAFASRFASFACPHVRDRHDMGCHIQGSRILQLLHRSSQGVEEVQVLHALLDHWYCRYDHPRRGTIR